MIIIDFDNLLNKAGNALNDVLFSIDKSLHSQIKNTTLDKFIHELSSYLDRADAVYKLNQLPSNAKLELNDSEDGALECYYQGERYYIPIDLVDYSDNNDFYYLQLQNNGKYHFVSKS